MNEDDFYKKIVKLLKMFNNRPYHLAKFMLDNSAFSKSFIENILNNKKLNSISDGDVYNVNKFTDISEMEEFYNSLVVDISGKNKEDLEIELNKRLDLLVKSEKYEDAIKVRDYMKKNNIRRI
jgi:HSP20 family molecular chaperone IbpA